MAYDGNWISQLVPTNPAGVETRSLGDDSIREIKRALKNSFPNVIEDDSYNGTLADLQRAVDNIIPSGLVAPWYGSWVTYPNGPDGWTIADGREFRTNPGVYTPDLSGRFILGAAQDGTSLGYPLYRDIIGGNSEIDIRLISSGALKTFVTDSTKLTAAQSGLPSHSHSVEDVVKLSAGGYDGGGGAASPYTTTVETTATGGTSAAQGHTHTFKIAGDISNLTFANFPYYYTMVYIIKD